MSRAVLIAVVVCSVLLPTRGYAQWAKPDTSGERGFRDGHFAARPTFAPDAVLLGAVSGFVAGFAVPALVFGTGSKGVFLGATVASGALLIGAIHLGTDVPLETERQMQGESTAYKEQFRKGYAEQLRHERKAKAIMGAVFGAIPGALVVGALLSMTT